MQPAPQTKMPPVQGVRRLPAIHALNPEAHYRHPRRVPVSQNRYSRNAPQPPPQPRGQGMLVFPNLGPMPQHKLQPLA